MGPLARSPRTTLLPALVIEKTYELNQDSTGTVHKFVVELLSRFGITRSHGRSQRGAGGAVALPPSCPPVKFGDLTSALPLRLTYASLMKFVDLLIGHLKNSPVSRPNCCILTSL